MVGSSNEDKRYFSKRIAFLKNGRHIDLGPYNVSDPFILYSFRTILALFSHFKWKRDKSIILSNNTRPL